MPQNESKEGYEYTCAKIGTVAYARTFLFHFFQCCSKFFFLFLPTQGVKQMWKYHKAASHSVGLWFMIGMGENNAGDYHSDAYLWRQHGRWWGAWQKPDPGKYNKKALLPGAYKEAQHSTGPELLGPQTRKCEILARVGIAKPLGMPLCFLQDMGIGNSVLFFVFFCFFGQLLNWHSGKCLASSCRWAAWCDIKYGLHIQRARVHIPATAAYWLCDLMATGFIGKIC